MLVDPAEIKNLSERYGCPEKIEVILQFRSESFLGELVKKRRGEVVFVIQSPNGKVLIITKTFYPAGVYRLPTGGIKDGESVESALFREVEEETGLSVEIDRFLAFIHYHLFTRSGMKSHFISYVFLVREIEGELKAQDQDEKIGIFREIDPGELEEVVWHLKNIQNDSGDTNNRWNDWGQFRTVAQEVVKRFLCEAKNS